MKCISCGAEITDQDFNCPYCNTPNEEAKARAAEVDKITAENRQITKQVLVSSGKEIYYRIHKRINIVLLAASIIAAIVGITIYSLQDKRKYEKPDWDKAKQLYESGNFEDLYTCLSNWSALKEDGYEEYGKAAFLWDEYRDCQDNFARSFEQYKNKGDYSSFYLRRSVEAGYQVLTNYVSSRYYTDAVSDTTKAFMAEYRENIIALFTGVYKIPMEKINSFVKYDYSTSRELEKYVVEVLNGQK